jgi:predicted MFS family arabinose efflux permease
VKGRDLVWAFVAAAFVSNIGTHMQSYSEQWLVYLQSHSALAAQDQAARWAGRISAASGIGVFFATPLGGWIADHWRRGRSLAITQLGLALLALAMAFLAWKGRLGLHGLVAFALTGGVFAGLMIPLQLSVVGKLQPDNASLFGMMQVQWNLSRILGPLTAATLFAILGAAGNFALNTLSFFPIILVILRLPDPLPAGGEHRAGTYGEALRALRPPRLREVMITAALFGLFGWTLLIFAPVYGARYLDLGARGVAGLIACFGLGAVASGLAVAARRLGRDTRRGMLQGLGCFAFALALTAFPGRMHTPPVLLLAGFGSGLAVTCLGSRVRELAPPAVLGRVNALYALAIVGLSPLGTLVAGEVGQRLGMQGPRWVLGLQGLLLLGWWVWLRAPSRAVEAPSIPA